MNMEELWRINERINKVDEKIDSLINKGCEILKNTEESKRPVSTIRMYQGMCLYGDKDSTNI